MPKWTRGQDFLFSTCCENVSILETFRNIYGAKAWLLYETMHFFRKIVRIGFKKRFHRFRTVEQYKIT